MQIKYPEIIVLNSSDTLVNSPVRKAVLKFFSWEKKKYYRTRDGMKVSNAQEDVFIVNRKVPGTFFVPTGLVPKIIEKLNDLEIEFKIKDDINKKIKTKPVGKNDIEGITLRDAQVELLSDVAGNPRGVIHAATGVGKCFDLNTEILMYDGSIKKIQNIKVGDQVMGPDSLPRTVKSLARGKDQMYRISPKDGYRPHTVTGGHKLSLVISGKKTCSGVTPGVPFDIEVSDFLKQTKTFKHCAKGYRSSGVEFYEENIPIDPYYLGLWIGDGLTRQGNIIYTPEKEILEYLYKFSCAAGMYVRLAEQKGCVKATISNKGDRHNNPIIDVMRSLGLNNVKFIPVNFKLSSIETRLRLLAGIIDTDGHKLERGNSYEVTSKHEHIAKDIAFIARSVGLSASLNISRKSCPSFAPGDKRKYFRVIIGGDTWKIPCKVERKICKKYKKQKDALRFGFSITSLGIRNYYGFEVKEDDKHFLLGDFTVTHNSLVALGIFHQHKQLNPKCKILFIAHTIDLVVQAAEQFKDHFSVGVWQGKKRTDGDIICATIQTAKAIGIEKLQKMFTVLVWDECFHKDTLIETEVGQKKISEIKVGDMVQTSTGHRKVTSVFENLVPVERVCRVKLSDERTIYCSIDHVFKTPSGELCAKNLQGVPLQAVENNRNTCAESVEVYKQGSNDELFQGIISDSEKKQGFVTFYDLEVEEDHEYYANGVLVHNCHHLSEPDKSYFAFVQDSFIPYRYGLTATLPTTKSGELSIESAIGPVIASYSINRGVDDGILAQPKVFMLVYGPQENYDREAYRFAYSEGIVKNKVRNKKIAALAKHLSSKGESVLIFVKEIPHGDNISAILKENNVDHFWIHGSHKSDDRKAIKKVIENKECLVGICSTIWNEGVSINSLNNCIVAPGGKDPKAIIQIVGRGTRISEGKTSVKIWDFLDRGKHLGNHCFDRINTYNENGWKIIIPPKKVK